MRTNTAPWDFKRMPFDLPPLNDTCPECGQPCFSGAIPNGKLYNCPACKSETRTYDEEREKDMWRRMFDRLDLFLEVKELVHAARAIRAWWDMPLKDKEAVIQYGMELDGYQTGQEIRSSLGI